MAELRKALYGLFSQYGTVLDIVAQKSLKLRGQAFIIFRDIGSASTALKALQSFAFYDKPMVPCPPLLDRFFPFSFHFNSGARSCDRHTI
jgi:hypothetical protein